VNLAVPWGILRLATRRRVWGVRLLLALPAVVALPMTSFLMLKSLTPALSDSHALLVFTSITLAGLPILAYLALVGSSLLRRRWRRFATWVGLTALASIAVGTWWLWSDMRVMPMIEHYEWSGGWYRLTVLGAYIVGTLVLIARSVRGFVRFVWRLGRHILIRAV
jgi:hypothetical protein